jgi:hypothetical protein
MSALIALMVASATLIDGLLAGAGLDQVIKQLPSRRQIGAVAYSRYFMAADLANGRFWYGALGILAYLLTVISAITGYLEKVDFLAMALLLFAAVLALVHMLGTARAAPTAFKVRKANSDETILNELFDTFSKWTAVRGIAGLLMFAAILLALVTIA